MDAQQILDILLKSGQELVDKGKTLAEAKLNLPEDPAQRKQVLDSAGKGAIAASALAVLLGTSTGRKLTGASLKLGSLAAIGSVAFQAYQNWQNQQGQSVPESKPALTELPAQAADQRSKTLLKAMIAAAKADGHIDEQEKNAIAKQVASLNLGDSAATLLIEELNKPLDINELAKSADSPENAAEIYVISRIVLNVDNDQERQYLDQLGKALGLAPELVAQLESQVGVG